MTSTDLTPPLQSQAFTNSSRIKQMRLTIFSNKRFLGSLRRFAVSNEAVFKEEISHRIPARYENKTSNAVFGENSYLYI